MSKIVIGRLCLTETVITLVRTGVVDILQLLERHEICDCGNISEARKALNESGVKDGGQIVSRYDVAAGLTIVIYTIEGLRITRCMELGEFLDDDTL
jgi:hypothetical protein